MAKTLDDVIQAQLGGMVFQLAVKDVQIQQLQEEIAKLKAELEKKDKE